MERLKKMNKRVAITGASGQCGATLIKILLNRGGFDIYGMKRRSSSLNTQRLDDVFNNPNLKLLYGDLADQNSIDDFIKESKPDYFFNLAAQSFVAVSFGSLAEYTHDITGTGVQRVLESLRKYSPQTRFLQMSSSEMFGGASKEAYNENSQLDPKSPYGIAKCTGYYATKMYRDAYKMHCSNAINFNFEGNMRGETFITRKITRAATRIKLGLQDKLHVGNIHAFRDWSACFDVCQALIKIIEADEPDDYVVCSEETHTIEEFLDLAFSKLNLNYKDYLVIDEKYFRPLEVDHLLGSSKKIREKLGWKKTYTFDQLVSEMIESDLKLAEEELLIKTHKNK